MSPTRPSRKSRDLAPVHAAWAFAVFALIVFLIAFTSSVRADSLWSAGGQTSRSMFADRKAAAKGDILTIVIAESAVAQISQNKSSSRESSIQDAISRFIYPSLGAHKGELPSIATSGKS